MNLSKLQYFLTVAETLNFTEAAKHHYISQTAMSQQIQSLEKELGVTLFLRNKKKVELTPAGQRLITESRILLDQQEHLYQVMTEYTQAEKDTLCIEYAGPIEKECLREPIAEFRQRYPHIRVKLKYVNQGEASQDLLQGKCDLTASVYEEFQGKKVNSLLLKENPVGVVVSRRNPLAACQEVTLEQLSKETLIILTPDVAQQGHDYVKKLILSLGIQETQIREAESLEDQLFLIELNQGVSLLPCADQLYNGERVCLPLKGVTMNHRIGLFYREKTPLIQKFLHLL